MPKKLQLDAPIIWGEMDPLISCAKQIEVIKYQIYPQTIRVFFPMKNNGCFETRPLSSKSSRRAASAGFSEGSTVPLTSCIPASGCRNIKISRVAFEHRETIGQTFCTIGLLIF